MPWSCYSTIDETKRMFAKQTWQVINFVLSSKISIRIHSIFPADKFSYVIAIPMMRK